MASYLSAKLTACVVGEDSRRIEIRTKIDIVASFLDRYKASRMVKRFDNNVPWCYSLWLNRCHSSCKIIILCRRVKEVYINEWDKTKGISVDELFVALHPSLKAEVMCHLYEDSIRQVSFPHTKLKTTKILIGLFKTTHLVIQSPLFKALDDAGVRMLASTLQETFLVEGKLSKLQQWIAAVVIMLKCYFDNRRIHFPVRKHHG